MKKVVKKEGVRLPSGELLPMGTNVGLHQYVVHRDEDIYEGADEFRPLRFIGEKGSGGVPLVQTSATFMAFSHGRHAWYVILPTYALSVLDANVLLVKPWKILRCSTNEARACLHRVELRYRNHTRPSV